MMTLWVDGLGRELEGRQQHLLLCALCSAALPPPPLSSAFLCLLPPCPDLCPSHPLGPNKVERHIHKQADPSPQPPPAEGEEVDLEVLAAQVGGPCCFLAQLGGPGCFVAQARSNLFDSDASYARTACCPPEMRCSVAKAWPGQSLRPRPVWPVDGCLVCLDMPCGSPNWHPPPTRLLDCRPTSASCMPTWSPACWCGLLVVPAWLPGAPLVWSSLAQCSRV